MVESGDKAIDQHIRRFQRFLSQVKTRVFQIMQSTYTDARMIYVLGPDGAGSVEALRAAAMPGYDFVVTNEPTMKANAAEEIQAIQLVASTPLPWRDLVARRAGIAPADLERVAALEQQMAENQAGQPTPPAPPASPSPVQIPGLMQ